MPLTLLQRCGHDSLNQLEAAARRRYAEATLLLVDQQEPFGAIYLLGYTIEMRLKAAYLHLIQFPPHDDFMSPQPNAAFSEWKIATNQIKLLLSQPHNAIAQPQGKHSQPGHNLYGWALLLIDTRAAILPNAPFPHGQKIMNLVTDVQLCWREILRYHAKKPYDEEVKTVQNAARWFRSHYTQLWS